MKKKYLTPDVELIRINLSFDVLGASTFTPEETIKEDVVDEEILD